MSTKKKNLTWIQRGVTIVLQILYKKKIQGHGDTTRAWERAVSKPTVFRGHLYEYMFPENCEITLKEKIGNMQKKDHSYKFTPTVLLCPSLVFLTG